mmetsp:Transcript_45245/g.144990  ORF Transcript_45245/g.144990 Transcript_45245/m.144990 type:complete len:290 (+) Transcript_45245:814-1683(+)
MHQVRVREHETAVGGREVGSRSDKDVWPLQQGLCPSNEGDQQRRVNIDDRHLRQTTGGGGETGGLRRRLGVAEHQAVPIVPLGGREDPMRCLHDRLGRQDRFILRGCHRSLQVFVLRACPGQFRPAPPPAVLRAPPGRHGRQVRPRRRRRRWLALLRPAIRAVPGRRRLLGRRVATFVVVLVVVVLLAQEQHHAVLVCVVLAGGATGSCFFFLLTFLVIDRRDAERYPPLEQLPELRRARPDRPQVLLCGRGRTPERLKVLFRLLHRLALQLHRSLQHDQGLRVVSDLQ